MDAKAPSSTYYTHIETRLSFETAANPIICVQLPSNSTFARTSKSSRRVVSALPNSQNEEEYRYRRLASSSGIHFRNKKRYPRSILWRILEDNKVVELRCLDLSKDHDGPQEKEPNLVLRVGFPSQIIKDGAAVKDSADEDVISLLVLTTANELYTITLKPLHFCKPAASEDDFDRLVTIFKPASLSLSSPFRFKAASAHEVFISLADGRMLQLLRQAGEDGSHWHETAYSDGQWGSSLRGLIRWSAGSNTVSYEGATLDHSTALGMVLSPGSTHLHCVGLNHTLKIWNLKTGQANITRDILDIERDPSETQKVLIHPSASNLLGIFECTSGFDGDIYYLVTFSPHSSGVFKFWGVRDPDSSEYGIRDLFENDVLRAPELDDGVAWTVVDFRVHAEPLSSNIDIWVFMKLNRRYKIFRRSFMELKSIGAEWSEGWSVTVVDAAKREPFNEAPLAAIDFNAQNVSERWLEFILAPGRYGEAILETALTLYIEGRKLQAQKHNRSSIRDRIANTLGSPVILKSSLSDTASDEFNDELANEWISFWKTIVEIDQLHWDPLALGFDQLEDTPYTVFSNGFAVIRDLSELEMIAYNSPANLQSNQDLSVTQSIEMDDLTNTSVSPDRLAAVVEAAATFRASFTTSLKASAQFELQNEVWKEPSLSIPERIQQFYDVCDFETEIGDRVYNSVISKLKATGDQTCMTTEAVMAILSYWSNKLPATQSLTRSGTRMGTKILSRGVVDMLAVQERVVTDLLYLVVFFAAEGEADEMIASEVNSNEVYPVILDHIRETQVTRWLVANRSSISLDRQGTSTGFLPNSALPPSILEQDFVSIIRPRATLSQSQSAALTHSIRDVETYTWGNNEISLDAVLSNTQCMFIKRGDIDLASSFAQFQPSDSWGLYIRARLHLTKQEFTEATHYFRKAAFELSRMIPAKPDLPQNSSGLIQQAEQDLFYSGFANYYTHLVSLFSTHQAHGQIMNFAELALQHCQASNASLRSDLLARIFHASIALKEYSIAYAALVRHTDKALQKSALAELITRMISNNCVEEMLSLPLTTLKKDVEKILSEKAEKEVGLPIKSTSDVPYFKILYAFHIRHQDFRAAASVLVSRLEARHEQRMTNARQHRFLNSKQESEKALDEYLVGINALALLGPEDDDDDQDEAWVFVGGENARDGGKKRRVMRIEGLRERYQSEMDRISAIELGRWGVVDDDDEEDDEMDGIKRNHGLVTA